MSRCKACDTILEGNELTRKDNNGEYFDLCGPCLSVSEATRLELGEDNEETGGTNTLNDLLTLNE